MTDARDDGARGMSVSAIIDQLDMLSEGVTIYLDLETHEFVTILDPSYFGADVTEDQPDPEDLEGKRFAALPDAFDIHEWAILRDFCAGVDDLDLRRRLLRAVHGRGAFRATKDVLHEHGLEDAWYAARERALEEIARDWLASLGLVAEGDEPTEQERDAGA
jgi:hypothetical protein